MKIGSDSLKTKSKFLINNTVYYYFSLKKAEKKYFPDISRLPYSLKILLENLLRCEDGNIITKENIQSIVNWKNNYNINNEIYYYPTRILMQDFTGVPAILDLAAMREIAHNHNKDVNKISPKIKVDLIIDHSINVDSFGKSTSLKINTMHEFNRNNERYNFLRWGQKVFSNFRVIPPGQGICHQINLEYLSTIISTYKDNNSIYIFPEIVIGTDSHTTMINSLGILGWGVGGIEAESSMLGQPMSLIIPEVVGFKLQGHLKDGVTSTDLALTITQILRKIGVIGKFVEFYGSGISNLSLPDRSIISNMAPEYGATCGFFPTDQETLKYLSLTGCDDDMLKLIKKYCMIQGIWYDYRLKEPIFKKNIFLDISTVEPSLSGPKHPKNRIHIQCLPDQFNSCIKEFGKEQEKEKEFFVNQDYTIKHGHIVIAAITSCTNTSNPNNMIIAGLVAKKLVEIGLTCKPWVKTSLSPGSKVVTRYLVDSGLQIYLDKLGFNVVGYGCTTCIGNSGPLPKDISNCIKNNKLIVCSILSGNRNFEGRIHHQVKINWIASPPLVIIYSIVGTSNINLIVDPIGRIKNRNIYLKDIWPSAREISSEISKIKRSIFIEEYKNIFSGDKNWKNIIIKNTNTYCWNKKSTYIQYPPFFNNFSFSINPVKPINNAYILAIFGDSITTDHISPAGRIDPNSPAGLYLKYKGVREVDFNSYGSRRGNHNIMLRGTFSNPSIQNEMILTKGGMTLHIPSNKIMSIYDASKLYKKYGHPLIIIAGKEYGIGSSRDWAAKGTYLLGVRAVIAESFERIHRSNLIGMGILPLQFQSGINRNNIILKGNEKICINIVNRIKPNSLLDLIIIRDDNSQNRISVICRIETTNELEYYYNGGILPYTLRKIFNYDTITSV